MHCSPGLAIDWGRPTGNETVSSGSGKTTTSERRSRLVFPSRFCVTIQWLCATLLPLPQILLSSPYICLGFIPNQFFPLYSVVFLLALPLAVHCVLFISMIVFDLGRTANNQVYPAGDVNPIDVDDDRSLVQSICLMGILFALLGYAPRAILGIVDLQSPQNVILSPALEVLPSLTLAMIIGWIYKIYAEIRKKIPSICKC